MNCEWERLESDMLRTGMFHGPRLNSRFLAQNFYAGRAVVRIRPAHGRTEYCAYIAVLPTKEDRYCEVALAYVAPDLEGNGLLKEIMGELLTLVPRGRMPMPFLFTRSPAVKKAAAGFGFSVQTRAGFRLWPMMLGLEDRIPESAKLAAPRPLKEEERVLMTRFDVPGYEWT